MAAKSPSISMKELDAVREIADAISAADADTDCVIHAATVQIVSAGYIAGDLVFENSEWRYEPAVELKKAT